MNRRQFLTVAAGALAAFAPAPAEPIRPAAKPLGWAKWSAEECWRPVYFWLPPDATDGRPAMALLDNSEYALGVPYAVVACYADAA